MLKEIEERLLAEARQLHKKIYFWKKLSLILPMFFAQLELFWILRHLTHKNYYMAGFHFLAFLLQAAVFIRNWIIF